MKTKILLLTTSLLLLSSFSACGEKEQKESSKKIDATTQSTPVIEVTHNENAREIKVSQKSADVNQSKSYYLGYNIKSAYDENSRPANSDASVRVKPRTSVDANMHIRSPYEKVQTSMLVRKNG